ncbi:MAG: hypothetical protein D5R96_03320 [Methanocalculus sp. MSAO_Arc2]|uniref:hypothetical protein n=1 Tax=Methanocalculus sp. MSAO_Arc2 TaxID=2293855 RepID=UPI000FECEB36|nr:MAG: hypothetical protein D5R96_03320 [Methanocalculus sp. MSAO_Arc2]
MLEETFTFRYIEDAMDFANEVKKDGCKVRIESGCECSRDYELQLPIKTIRSIAEKDIRERNAIDDDDTLNKIDEKLSKMNEEINRFFGSAGVGDLIQDPIDREEIISRVYEFFDLDVHPEDTERDEEEITREKECREAAIYMNTARLLVESGMIKEEPGGWRVLEEIDSQKICIPIPAEFLEQYDLDDIKEMSKRGVIRETTVPIWRVIASPSFYMSDIIDRIEDVLDEYGVDEIEIDQILDSIHIKETIIELIYQFIKENEVVSLQEIIKECQTKDDIMTSEGLTIISKSIFHPVVIEGIVMDLKKLNYIKGKEEKLRLA